jgi:hypothetical protein
VTENWFLGAAIALLGFALWALVRHDWLRLTRKSRRVNACVTGHRTRWEDSGRSYAAIYAFSDESGNHEVVDAVHDPAPRLVTGTVVELIYPEGRPDLARPARPFLWIAVYLLLLYGLGVIAAKALGYIPG